MKYILITDDNKTMKFFVKELAIMYQSLHGGMIFVEEENEDGKPFRRTVNTPTQHKASK